MSMWNSAVSAAVRLAAIVEETTTEPETAFNPDLVSPGWEGFLFTAILAGGVIVLGFLLVRTIRKNTYREEARESIEAELAELAERDAELAGQGADAAAAAGADAAPDLDAPASDAPQK